MKSNVLKITLYLLILLNFNRCAQIGVLNGGEKDTTPPKLLEAFPLMQSTNFSSNIIVLKFDEFVKLKDLNNQLLISPKIKNQPEITANGKKVVIKMNASELLPNTTYKIYFGTAIADMHEGNSINNFAYVFSTGSEIDTLKFKGKVVNAYTAEAEKDVVAGLYYNENLSDSFPYKQTPDYLARTNEEGLFEMENLPSKEFKLVCFTDKNKDYLYNGQETESIGFLNDLVKIGTDSSAKLKLFKEKAEKVFVKKVVMTEYGKGMILFNTKSKIDLSPVVKEASLNFTQVSPERNSDTCIFYYKEIKDSLWLQVNYENQIKSDTLMLKVPVFKFRNRRVIKPISNFENGKLSYWNKPTFKMQTWVNKDKFRPEGVFIVSKKDTLMSKTQIITEWLDENTLVFKNDFKPKIDYTIKLDTSVFVNYIGYTNDSLSYNFNVLGKKEFGSLSLKVTFNKKQAYIIQLLTSDNRVAKQAFTEISLSSTNITPFVFNDLTPGQYKVRVIYDDNSNKLWDTGNFLLKNQAENTFIFEKAIKVIPDWEIEEEFIIRE